MVAREWVFTIACTMSPICASAVSNLSFLYFVTSYHLPLLYPQIAFLPFKFFAFSPNFFPPVVSSLQSLSRSSSPHCIFSLASKPVYPSPWLQRDAVGGVGDFRRRSCLAWRHQRHLRFSRPLLPFPLPAPSTEMPVPWLVSLHWCETITTSFRPFHFHFHCGLVRWEIDYRLPSPLLSIMFPKPEHDEGREVEGKREEKRDRGPLAAEGAEHWWKVGGARRRGIWTSRSEKARGLSAGRARARGTGLLSCSSGAHGRFFLPDLGMQAADVTDQRVRTVMDEVRVGRGGNKEKKREENKQ